MRKATLFWTLGMLWGVPAFAQEPSSPEAEVRAVAAGFSDALAQGDSLRVLSYLHDDVLILEGSRAETKEQYRSGHLAADIRFASTVQRETVRDGATITGETALYTRQYRVTGTSGRGEPIDRTSTEALVMVRTPEGWRIRHVHWF